MAGREIVRAATTALCAVAMAGAAYLAGRYLYDPGPAVIHFAARGLEAPGLPSPSVGVAIGFVCPASRKTAEALLPGFGEAAVNITAWPPACRRMRVVLLRGRTMPAIRWLPAGCDRAMRS